MTTITEREIALRENLRNTCPDLVRPHDVRWVWMAHIDSSYRDRVMSIEKFCGPPRFDPNGTVETIYLVPHTVAVPSRPHYRKFFHIHIGQSKRTGTIYWNSEIANRVVESRPK